MKYLILLLCFPVICLGDNPLPSQIEERGLVKQFRKDIESIQPKVCEYEKKASDQAEKSRISWRLCRNDILRIDARRQSDLAEDFYVKAVLAEYNAFYLYDKAIDFLKEADELWDAGKDVDASAKYHLAKLYFNYSRNCMSDSMGFFEESRFFYEQSQITSEKK